VLGDSLSAAYGMRPEQGWVALLQKRLETKDYGYRVVNASVSGETTAGGLQRLPRALQLHKPSIVVVELGSNDALRGLPIATARENLTKIVTQAKATGAQVLLVGMRIPPNYGPRYTAEFMDMFTRLSKDQQLPLVPFLMDKVALDDAYMQDDGLHPNPRAQPTLLDTVWTQLAPMLDKRR